MRVLRRQFLATAAQCWCAGVVGGVYATAARAQSSSASAAAFGIEELRGGVRLITGSGGNVLLLSSGRPAESTADGTAAMIDTGSPAGADELLRYVTAALDGRRPELVFNTHWRESHTGGNDLFAADETRIVAHENTRLWMNTEYYVDWEDRNYQPRAAAALPNETFFSSAQQPIRIELGGETFEYAHLREACTDGDIYVRLLERNIIATGGVCTAARYPVPDYATGGWIGGLIEATSRLIGLCDADTIIVPGYGPAQKREHLQRQHTMLVAVREKMEVLMREGRSVEEMLAAGVTDEFDQYWGDNTARFVANVYGGLWWVGRLTNSL